MEKFGFVMHPLNAKRDISRKYPVAKLLPESMLEAALKVKSPMMVSHVTGVKSIAGPEAEGWFVGCPLTPKLLASMPTEVVYRKIIDTVKMAEDQGAKIVGLGAHTSVVGDGGVTIAKNSKIAITTGNSFTVATGIEGSLKAAEMMGIDPAQASAAVVGACGSIGWTCSQVLAKRCASITMVDISMERLEQLKPQLAEVARGEVSITTDIEQGIKDADIVITVSSAVKSIIEPHFIKRGAVVCDIARPRDVSARVQQERNDVLVIEGGVVEVPGADLDLGFNFGFPPKTAYACMSETMMLALEGRYENFTLGKTVSLEQVEETQRLAAKHGFKLAGFRNFEKSVTQEQIDAIRKNAGRG